MNFYNSYDPTEPKLLLKKSFTSMDLSLFFFDHQMKEKLSNCCTTMFRDDAEI